MNPERRMSWCSFKDFGCPSGCELESPERKLREAHRHWHACGDSYQDPEDFRIGLNAVIQALRNVTFSLQSIKSNIPGFDEWYTAEQEIMRVDPLLRWVISSRNKVVKQGDLETLSENYVSIIADYFDESAILKRERQIWEAFNEGEIGASGLTIEEKPPLMSMEEVLNSLHLEMLPVSVRERLTVYFERRWIEMSLPNFEVMTVLAYCYGKLRSLVSRAHLLLGKQAVHMLTEDALPGGKVEQEDAGELQQEGRLPCMVSSRRFRTTRRRFQDGSEVDSFTNYQPGFDPVIAEKALESERYGPRPIFPREKIGTAQTQSELQSLLSVYAKTVKGVLKSGEDHGWFTYYFRGGRLIDSRIHIALDAQGKRAIASEIAYTALGGGADAVVMIVETWISEAHLTKDGAYYPPSLDPSRTEAVMIQAISKSGTRVSKLIPFHVLSGEAPNRHVHILEDEGFEMETSGLLLPTLEAWGVFEKPREGLAFWKAQRKDK